MTFASLQLPVAELRWVLTGPAGAHVDTIVAGLIGAGVSVESIKPGTTYRLRGSTELMTVLADELAQVEGLSMAREVPPTDAISVGSTLAPSHPYRRAVTVHGPAASPIARAVDRRLTVSTVGINRWSVGGRTADLLPWLAATYGKPVDEVMALFGWTAESVAAEDAAPTVAVNLPPIAVAVTLPDRKTTSDITRDAAGEITQVLQFERSV